MERGEKEGKENNERRGKETKEMDTGKEENEMGNAKEKKERETTKSAPKEKNEKARERKRRRWGPNGRGTLAQIGIDQPYNNRGLTVPAADQRWVDKWQGHSSNNWDC
jgi:hypothetical protein